jgi:hypothetical protein
MENKKSSIMKIKEFFGFNSMAAFREEWNALSNDEKEWFKQEIEKV